MPEKEHEVPAETRAVFREPTARQHPTAKGSNIIDFCSTLKNCTPDSKWVGSLQEEGKCYHIYQDGNEAKPRSKEGSKEEKCLATALGVDVSECPGMVDRWLLALDLASTICQLYSTSWLDHEWSKRDIVFYRNGPNSAPFTWKEPYLSLVLHQRAEETGSKKAEGPAQSPLRTEERLAIILLELCFNQALEESKSYKEMLKALGQGAMLDRFAAHMWKFEVGKHTARAFADAIDWCLQNKSKDTSMAKRKWIEAFYKNVVMPLQQCCVAMERPYNNLTDIPNLGEPAGSGSTNFHGEVSKGGVSFLGPTIIKGNQSIGGMTYR
ncbi:hypothetical protein BP6252_10830 [Coleophoma cylindrospora]|uniref:DUF7580 domain-containing protein n=1 Tax=Coleophoma cylindrospora TaxID=1849047 RepID=A0A3D8QNA9_9HELO|nr:hypothetical protein BP6252_10830 [Coleophoma cylindrospora]